MFLSPFLRPPKPSISHSAPSHRPTTPNVGLSQGVQGWMVSQGCYRSGRTMGPAPPPAMCSPSPPGASRSAHTACSPCSGISRKHAPCFCFHKLEHLQRWRACHRIAGGRDAARPSGPRSSRTQAPDHTASLRLCTSLSPGHRGRVSSPTSQKRELRPKQNRPVGGRTGTEIDVCPSSHRASTLWLPEGQGGPCSHATV